MTVQQSLAVGIIVVMMGLFVWGRLRYDLVAALALIASVAVGIVPAKQAFSGFSDREVSLAMSAANAGLKPRPPNNAADAPADAAAPRMKLRRDGCRGPPLLDIVFLPNRLSLSGPYRLGRVGPMPWRSLYGFHSSPASAV